MSAEDQWHYYYPGMYDLYEGGYWNSDNRYNYLEDFILSNVDIYMSDSDISFSL